MAGRIVVFGATGYTGSRIAQRLVASGVAPVLAGRDTGRLEALSDRLGGGADVVRADSLRQNSVFSLVDDGDVLVSTVGPFAKYGTAAVRAAIAAGATYLDSTGEPAFIRRVFEQFAGPAEKNGAALLTAQGYDWVPGALAGALALEDAGPDAVRVDVGYFVRGMSASAGTKESLIGATLDPGYRFSEGTLSAERGAARVRAFDDDGGQAFSAGGAEHFTVPLAYPALREVNTYIGAGPFSRGVQAVSVATTLAQRGVGGGVFRAVMQAAAERAIAALPDRSDGVGGSATSRVVATAHDREGQEIGRTVLDGPDPYDFTASFMAWAARRAAGEGLEGAGALSPVLAYGGLAGLHAGCAAAGISERT